MVVVTIFLTIRNPLDSLSGPIGIVTLANQNSTTLKNSIEFGGILSFSIGMFNLLPIYPLDGGQTISLFFEKIKLNKAKKYFKIIGLVSIVLLIGITTILDLFKLF